MSSDAGNLFAALAVLAMFLWPLMLIASAGFTVWILFTITVSVRGIRRELSRLNDQIERNGVVRLSGHAAADNDGGREQMPMAGYTRTSPLNLTGAR